MGSKQTVELPGWVTTMGDCVDPRNFRSKWGSWQVTREGMVSARDGRFVPKERLLEPGTRRIAFEGETVSWDFADCLDAAILWHFLPHRPLPIGPEPDEEPTWPGELHQIPPRLRFLTLRRDGYRCVLCGAGAADGARVEADHILPKSHGGTNVLSNLQTLCWPCNRGRSNLAL